MGPVKEWAGNERQHSRTKRIFRVAFVRIVEVVGVDRIRILNFAFNCPGIGVKEELCSVAAMSGSWIKGPADSVAVALSGDNPGNVAMPHIVVALCKFYAFFSEIVVYQAKLNGFGNGREKGKVCPCAVIRCA